MTQQLPDGYTTRPATAEDAEQIAALWNVRSGLVHGVQRFTADRVLSNWQHPRFDLSTDSRLVFDAKGGLIGYAHIRDVKTPPVDVFSGYSVHPSHDDEAWLWNDLFGWMETEARRVIPRAPEEARVVLLAGTSEKDRTEQRELERLGFEHNRTFHWMQTDFSESTASKSPPQIEGVRFRNIRPGADDEALVHAYLDAFSDHYGILKQPFDVELAEWRALMNREDFDATLWFIAEALEVETIVGFCVCRTSSPRDPDRGIINDLGVRSAWRRRGIGRALLSCAFSELAKRGVTGATLNVDTENKHGAPTLYERAGMHSVLASHTYLKELRPGIDLVPQ